MKSVKSKHLPGMLCTGAEASKLGMSPDYLYLFNRAVMCDRSNAQNSWNTPTDMVRQYCGMPVCCLVTHCCLESAATNMQRHTAIASHSIGRIRVGHNLHLG